jgi:uncharacterized membrane protein YkvA (DUF1232 family)
MPRLFSKLRAQSERLKRDLTAMYLAARDPRTPWYAKVVLGCVVAYALSPIDLIPDFIPILGYLDDVLLLPLGHLHCYQFDSAGNSKSMPRKSGRNESNFAAQLASGGVHRAALVHCAGAGGLFSDR